MVPAQKRPAVGPLGGFTTLLGEATDDDSGILLPVILALLGGVAAVLLIGLGWWLARHRYAGMNGGEPPDG